MPSLTTRGIADVKHYTIVMARRGAAQVAAAIDDALAPSRSDSAAGARN